MNSNSLETYRPVFLPDPVNRNHPLNLGLVLWMLAVPGLDGGRLFYDLGGINHATLIQMGAGSGWSSSTRQGSLGGSLLLDGLDDFIRQQSQAWVPALVNGWSTSLWFYSTNPAKSYQMIITCSGGGANNTTFEIRFNDTTSKIEIVAGAANFREYSGSTTIVSGQWYHALATNDGTTLNLYLNGKIEASGTGVNSIYTAATNDFIMGDRAAAGGYYLQGAVDDARVWSRALSAAEALAVYELSCRGYPEMLNRIPPILFSNVGAAPDATFGSLFGSLIVYELPIGGGLIRA